MTDRPIVLLALSDGDRADRLAMALDTDGDFLITMRAVAEGVDVSVSEDGAGHLNVTAGILDDAERPAARLPRNAADPLVIAAIRLVAAGYTILRNGDEEIDGQPLDLDGALSRQQRPILSAREMEVLNLLADGAPNKVIARALDISVHTAKFHVASLLTKLGAANRTDAIAIAMREGLVPM